MSKGSYTVYKPQKPNSKLNSWKSCTCSLLIFAVISLIIILVAWPLKKTNEADIFTGESAKVYKYTESVEIFPVKNETQSVGKYAKIISSTVTSFEETHASTESFKNKDEINKKSGYVPNKPQDITTELYERHGKFTTILTSTGRNSSTDQPERDESTVTEVNQNTLKNIYFHDDKTESSDKPVKDEKTVTEVNENTLKNLYFNDNETESSGAPVTDESTLTEVNQNTLKNLHFNDNKTESSDELVTEESTVTELNENTLKNFNFNDNKTESSGELVKEENIVTEVNQNTLKNLYFNDNKTESPDELVKEENIVTEVNKNILKNLYFNDNKTESSDEPGNEESSVTEIYQKASYTSMKNLHFNDNKTESLDEPVKNESTVTEIYQKGSYTSMKSLHFNNNITEPTDQPIKDESTVTQIYQNTSYTSMKNLQIVLFNDNKTESSNELVKDESTVTEVYQYALSHSTDSSTKKGLKLIDNTTIDQPEKGMDTVTEQYQNASTQRIEGSTTKSQYMLTVNDKETDSTQTAETLSIETHPYKATTDFSQRENFDNNKYLTKELYTKHNNTVLTACQSTIIYNRDICDTNTCKNIGSKVLTLMKHDENICNNFYNYACGGISKDFLVEKESSADLWNRLKNSLDGTNDNSSDYLVAFKNYYLSCMGYDFWNELPANILEDVGTFYGRSDDFNDAPTLTMLLTTMLTKNYAALFDIKVDIDIKSQKLGLVILPVFDDDIPVSLSAGNINYKNICLEKSNIERGKVNLNDVYSRYKACQLDKSLYISNVQRALLAFNAFPSCNETDKVTEIQHLLFTLEEHILNGLNQSMQPLVTEQNKIFKSKSSLNLSLHSLKLRLPQIKWDYLFKELIGYYLPSDVNIQVYFVNYLSKLLNTLTKVNKRELHNNILAMYAHKLYKDYVLDHRDICDKSLHCIQLSSNHMQDISSALYLESFKANEIIEMDKNAKDIFKFLKKSLLNEIQNGNWLSKEDPENRAYDKIYDLNLTTVGDLMPWKDKDNLFKRLKEMNIRPDCFIENTNVLEQRNRKLLYSSFDSDPTLPENLWTLLSLPYATKPSNIIALNTIVLPLGAMSHYLDNPGSPKFVSMAGLGFSLAKQMNYLLELSGIPILRKIDMQPDNIFFEMNQTIDGRPLTIDLNPNESVTEIVTDVAGAKLAYLAYKKYISKKDFPLIWTNTTTAQSYFLLLAQQFCTKKTILLNHLGLFEGTELPAMFAVNSIAVNTDEFFEVFNNCAPETNMTAGIRIPLISSTFTTKKIDTMDTTK